MSQKEAPAPAIGQVIKSAMVVQFVRIVTAGEADTFRGPFERIVDPTEWHVVEVIRQDDHDLDYVILRKGIHRAYAYLDAIKW